jgi:divalent metal cation (Fe/Co/Zn/Cd) transporter
VVTVAAPVSAQQRARERSIEFALALDVSMLALYALAAIVAGSLTMFAELIRGVLMTVIEVFALAVMKRIHRGRTAMFEFGSGKLEQLVNLLIAGGMLAGAAWIAVGAVGKIAAGDAAEAGTPMGFALAAIAAGFNAYENVLAWDAMRRAAQSGGSLIMSAQLKARVVKLVSSFCVVISLTIAAFSADTVVCIWADCVGALLICGFIVHAGLGMIRADLPDLVDRAVNEEVQAAINRMLLVHFDDYDRLDRVRTRRSGAVIHAEITLGFHRDLTMADVNRRIDAMKASLRREVGEADIAIVAVAG